MFCSGYYLTAMNAVFFADTVIGFHADTVHRSILSFMIVLFY